MSSAAATMRMSPESAERCTPDQLLDIMRHDKKAQSGKLKFVLVRGIGHAFIADHVPLEAVRGVLAD